MRNLDAAEIVETFDIPEERVGGLAYTERLSDGDWRFVFFCERRGVKYAKLAISVSEERALEGMRHTADKFGFALVPKNKH